MWIIPNFLFLSVIDAIWPKIRQISVAPAFQQNPLNCDYGSCLFLSIPPILMLLSSFCYAYSTPKDQ
uniref:Secreted protein n=1 Tax=Panagrellus redivivus TaxID=6233 RepID=A0A7E4VB69_PANRE